jgi:hypothetical protein
MGKHFIYPKSSEFCPFFKFFLLRRKLPFFWPKLLPALFLKKPRYPCPFEILEETLQIICFSLVPVLALIGMLVVQLPPNLGFSW